MFIRNGKRFNIHAPVEHEGVRYANAIDQSVQQLLGITEIDDPAPPEGYSPATHYRTESDDPPYVVYTEKSPEMIAAERWEAIKAHRDMLIDNGGAYVASIDKWFHSDAKSKLQQLALVVQGANLPLGIMWKTMDGSFVELTQQIVLAVFVAQAQREQQIFGIAEAKRQDNSPVLEGWPEHFQLPSDELSEP